MKGYIQWSAADPLDYDEFDSADWPALPKGPVPVGREVIDNIPRWPFDLVFQGISFAGADHYHVEDVADGGVKVTTWWDDPEDLSPDDFWAEVWTILPLAPDPRLGGAINTRQSRVIYAAPGHMAKLNPDSENTVLRPWSEFVPPAGACHGIWVPDRDVPRHEDVQTLHGWREWGEDGPVPNQRRLGRFPPAEGTITYFLYDEALASGVHVAEEEVRQEVVDINVPANLRCDLVADTPELCYVWTTDSDEPNIADWPNGAYRVQIDVTGIMRLVDYGFLTTGGVDGHMARVNAGLTSDLENWTQTEAAFTGTGIKLATRTIDPAAGASTDRWECLLAVNNSGETMAGRIDISMDDSDSFSDGPWVTGGAMFTQSVDGSLSFVGDLTRKTTIFPAGTLTFAGVLGTVRTAFVSVAGTLSFAGALATLRKAFASLAGVLSFAGALGTKAFKQLAGSLSFAGALSTVRKAFASLAGSLSFAGALATQVRLTKAVAGVLSFSGALTRLPKKALSGVVSFSGTLGTSARKRLTGVLTFAGTLTRVTRKRGLAGVLSFAGDLAAQLVALITTGNISRTIRKGKSGG